jgi:hypothetical protein
MEEKMINASGSSFRDPAGFICKDDGNVCRVVTDHGREDYDLFMQSGLYDKLSGKGWVLTHSEKPSDVPGIYKILSPMQLTSWFYPYEWCFSQLKDAALMTLDIQKAALDHGMSLKDANPYNIQFIKHEPVLIDTLSFEKYYETPWVAYRQFCELFMAPLVLMAYISIDFNRYLKVDLNGFDLSVTSKMLPWYTWLNPGLLTHLHLHAIGQDKFAEAAQKETIDSHRVLSKDKLIFIIDSLRSMIAGLKCKRKKTIFGDYYDELDHYSNEADKFKKDRVKNWIEIGKPAQVLDLGGNTGVYSRLATAAGASSICTDFDPYCVEYNYITSKANGDLDMIPVITDLSNPSGDIGWNLSERDNFFSRVKPELVMALALIHHLRFTNNVPLCMISDFFVQFKCRLIIEFVPKDDPMVRILLRHRKDLFDDYDQGNFEKVFGEKYSIIDKERVKDTNRTLYYLDPKGIK